MKNVSVYIVDVSCTQKDSAFHFHMKHIFSHEFVVIFSESVSSYIFLPVFKLRFYRYEEFHVISE